MPDSLTQPSFGVVIPHYNDSRYMEDCLRSIFDASSTPNLIVIVDDGSEDSEFKNLELIIHKFEADQQNTVQLHRHYPNKGVVHSLNQGLSICETDFVLFRAADDRTAPDYLEKARQSLGQNAKPGLIVGDIRYYTSEPSQGPIESLALEPGFHSSDSLVDSLSQDTILHSATTWFRREALMEISGFDSEVDLYHDWWACHLIALKYGINYLPGVAVSFCVRQDSVSSTVYQDLERAALSFKAIEQRLSQQNENVRRRFERSSLLGFFSSISGVLSHSVTINLRQSGISSVITTRLATFATSIKNFPGRIAVYGTGNHSRILDRCWRSAGLPQPTLYIDSNSCDDSPHFLGISVQAIDTANLEEISLIVLSSKSFEEQMAKTVKSKCPNAPILSFWNHKLTTIRP